MVQILCCDGYRSMLWELSSNSAEQYFKSWNTCVKLINRVPRSTFTYLVEDVFAEVQPSLRRQILSRYPGFYRTLVASPSKEVRMLGQRWSKIYYMQEPALFEDCYTTGDSRELQFLESQRSPQHQESSSEVENWTSSQSDWYEMCEVTSSLGQQAHMRYDRQPV